MDNKQFKKLSRKDFLIRAGVVGTSFVLGSSIISEEKPKEVAFMELQKCDDVSGLRPDEVEQRRNLKYTDNSPEANKNCNNCGLYVSPKGKAACGGCTAIKGPVSPKGWCMAWVGKA